jgi:hypothetical protein
MSNDDYVVCGTDVARLMPTSELRQVETGHRDPLSGAAYPPVLQQKWVATAKMPDGGQWEEHRWRNVPTLYGEEARAALATGQGADTNER